MQSEKISTPIYVECEKIILRCIDHRFAFKNSEFWCGLPSLDIQPELSEMDNSAPKKSVARCETRKVI